MTSAQTEDFGLKTKRAALYVRASTKEENTDAQERSLKEYVERRGWDLRKFIATEESPASSRVDLHSTN